MNARRRPPQESSDNQSLKGPLIKSALFHLFIFLLTVVTIPFIAKPVPSLPSVSVDLVDISELTQTNKVAAPKKEPEKPIEEPTPPQQNLAPPKSMPESAPDIPEPEVPAPPKPEEKKPEPKKEPPKPEPKKEKPKPKPKPKEEKKEEKKDDADPFESMMKNMLDQDKAIQKTDNKEEPKDKAEAPAGAIAPPGAKLSMSEEDAVKRQITACWNLDPGIRGVETMSVRILGTIGRDMIVQNPYVAPEHQLRYNVDNAYKAFVNSALRALRNPLCAPLKLPPEKYESWKDFDFTFDPSYVL